MPRLIAVQGRVLAETMIKAIELYTHNTLDQFTFAVRRYSRVTSFRPRFPDPIHRRREEVDKGW